MQTQEASRTVIRATVTAGGTTPQTTLHAEIEPTDYDGPWDALVVATALTPDAHKPDVQDQHNAGAWLDDMGAWLETAPAGTLEKAWITIVIDHNTGRIETTARTKTTGQARQTMIAKFLNGRIGLAMDPAPWYAAKTVLQSPDPDAYAANDQ